MKRKSYHHGRLRETLVAHGVKLLARKGLEGLSLRQLARQAGVSAAAPYRHFPTAQALAEAIAVQGFQLLQATMLEAMMDPALAPLSPLERLGHGYLRFAQRNPEHLQLMFSGRMCPDPDQPDGPLHAAGQAAFGALTGTIVEAQQAGVVAASVDPAVLAVVAWSFIHGFSSLAIAGHLCPDETGAGLPLPDLADACQKLIKHGWGAKAGATS